MSAHRVLAVLLSAALAASPAASAPAARTRGHAPRPLAAFQTWAGTADGARLLARRQPRLAGLARLSPKAPGAQVVSAAVEKELRLRGRGGSRLLNGLTPELPAERVGAPLRSLARASAGARKRLLEYAGVVTRLVREGRFVARERGEHDALAEEFEAMETAFGGGEFQAAAELLRLESRRVDALSKAERNALALGAAAEDEFALAAQYESVGKSRPAQRRAEAAARLGHPDASRQLARKEVLRDWLVPLRPRGERLTLGDERPLRYFWPVAGLIAATLAGQFYAERLGYDAGLFSLPHRAVLGAAGFAWMLYERKARAAGRWSFLSGFKSGYQGLRSALPWLVPVMLAGIALSISQGQHDPVPPTIQAVFGGDIPAAAEAAKTAVNATATGAAQAARVASPSLWAYSKAQLLMPLAVSFEEAFVRLTVFGGLLYGFGAVLKRHKTLAFQLAAGLSATLFGLLHQQYNPFFMAGTAILGYFFAFAYYRSRWLWVPIAAHLYLNVSAIGGRMVLKLFGIDGLW